MTHRVTFWPCCKHFSGLGSFLLQSKNALLCAPHLEVMCLEADIKTAEVVMGASTAFSPIVAPAALAVIADPCLSVDPTTFSPPVSLPLSCPFASVLSSLGFLSLAQLAMANLPLSPWLLPALSCLSPTRLEALATLNMIFSVTHSNCLPRSTLIVILHGVVSPTLNVNPTLFVIPCMFVGEL